MLTDDSENFTPFEQLSSTAGELAKAEKMSWQATVKWWTLFSGPVHTTAEKLEKATLFLRLGLQSTLIRHGKGALRKRSIQTGRIWKRGLFVFVWTESILKTAAFRKRYTLDNHVISLTEFSSNTNPKWVVIVAFLNSVGVMSTENYDVFPEQNLRFQIFSPRPH